MDLIAELPQVYRIWLYVVMAVLLLYTVVVFVWQIRVLRGKPMVNPDGSVDDWHRQTSHYGTAFADVLLACPLAAASMVLVFTSPGLGFYLLGMVGFWLVWANTATTVTSLRFCHPRPTVQWVVTFPFGVVVGLATLLWPAAVVCAIGFPGIGLGEML